MSTAPTFATLLQHVRVRVDEELAAWLAPRVANASAVSAHVGMAAEAARDLSLRGGKRMRAALVALGYEAFDADRTGWDTCVPAMIAIELLQTYLLVQDDWMDDDDVRRGGPAVHVVLRERFGNKALGDAGAILAGDLSSAWAQAALLESKVAPERALRAVRAFAEMQVDVVSGQLAEMTTAPDALEPPVETVHALKTASYTVTGPLLVGAALAGAGAERAAGLKRFGRTLGVAFQLRDDLLGAFGDSAATGKPVGNDIRQGKRTALVAELLREPAGAAAWRLAKDDPEAVLRAMESGGAKARVERRVRELLDESRAALAALAPFITETGRTQLEGAITALGERSS